MTLPPGQRRIEGFPRFGTHLHHPPPPVPENPAIRIKGAVTRPFDVPLSDLAILARSERTTDFHCVAGWTATGLRWEGVDFATFYRDVIEPRTPPDTSITHLTFGGLDRYRCVVAIEDALADDVMIADRLDGRPLEDDHGAPVRLVSPAQYGFVSTKHLCEIELHTTDPNQNLGPPLFRRHPRARVWEQERHPYLPAWSVRPFYRLLIAPIRSLSARGGSSCR